MYLGKLKKIHFVGIGGIGMSGIAELMLNQGFTVTGSDLQRSETVIHLEALGAAAVTGHAPENIGDADMVIYSSAVTVENPELIEARKRGLPVIRRAEMLAELMRMKYSIAVAGTHGKTTTTSMVGRVMTEGKKDPTIIVGGILRSLDTNAKLGSGEFLVAEADEYDRSFLKLFPSIAVITTLEADHLDCYRDLDEIKDAFVEFANKVPFFGSVIVCLDETEILTILPRIEKRIITYGLNPQSDIRADNIKLDQGRTSCDVFVAGEPAGEISIQQSGEHNLKNALAAIAVGRELDIPFAVMKKALGEFPGVRRRFEIKGRIGETIIIDDYAHHPTEILATLKGAKEGWKKRTIAVFQPHLYSRTQDFAEKFGQSFHNADILIVADIYPAREKPVPGVTGDLIARKAREAGHKNVHYVPDKNDIVPFVKELLLPGDMVITMGAGDIWKTGETLVKELS